MIRLSRYSSTYSFQVSGNLRISISHHSFDLRAYDGKNKWTAYNFVRKLYDYFAPILLKIIQDAVSQLPNSRSESFVVFTISTSAENEADLPNSQEMVATSAPASQDTERVKKPRLTATAVLKEQLAQRDRQQRQLERENTRQKQAMEELREQMAQDKEEMAQEKEESKQRHTELMDLLKEQKEENKKLMDKLDKRLS